MSDNIEDLKNEIDSLEHELYEARALVHDFFNQACQIRSPDHPEGVLYDHQCMSTYEYAQALLLEWEMITPEQCYRYKSPCPGHDYQPYPAGTPEDKCIIKRCVNCGGVQLPEEEEKPNDKKEV